MILVANRVPKGEPFGIQNGRKIGPKTSRNLRTKKLRIGSDLGRFWVVLGGRPGSIFIDFLLVSYDFVEINVFDFDSRPRAILDQNERKRTPKGSQKGAKMSSKSIKNRHRKWIEILIDFGSILGPKIN